MNGLLKINVPQFIFLALSYIFAKNKCSFINFSSIFLKIVLKINVRLSLFRCHVCTVVHTHTHTHTHTTMPKSLDNTPLYTFQPRIAQPFRGYL